MAKKKVICDTDVMIDYWDVSKKRHASTKEVLDKEILLDNVVLSAITKMELLLGSTNKADFNKINKKLNRLNIALINNDIKLEAFELLQTYRLSHGLALPDCLIAATAKITELALFTYNIKDYKFIAGLKLFS